VGWFDRSSVQSGGRGAAGRLRSLAMNAFTLTVSDQTTGGETLAEFELQLEAERVTVAELIRARVHQEVRVHNAGAASDRGRFVGLVAPVGVERELNGQRVPRTVHAGAQIEVALRAFERGRVLLLVDDGRSNRSTVRSRCTPGRR
jgi:hypothetical protein